MDTCRSSVEILDHCAKYPNMRPLSIPEDGNCFFNSLSMHCKGDTSLATLFRFQTAMQLIMHGDEYQEIHRALGLEPVSTTFLEACQDAVSEKKWSPVWHLLAATDVLDRQIVSVYPPVNGSAGAFVLRPHIQQADGRL